MSVLDSFFNKGAFKAARCKTLLKLTIPRIKLLRNRREMHLKQMRREIAKLLENGQEATARIRVEHIIREENMMAAQEIIELFCELITVRLPIIDSQRECPLDLKEAISSICFAAPRCADLPELQQVQMLFAAKYGREFAVAATELMPDSGVNRQIIELLSIRAPPVEIKMKLLKEIAEEHEVDWDPTATESEFLKPHEDLLNGPGCFISGSKLPLPDEKHKDSLSSAPSRPTHEDSEGESDTGFDLDLPEVPKTSIRSSSVPTPDPDTVDSNSESDPAIVQTFPPAATSDLVFKRNITLDALAVGSEPSTASVHIPPTSAVDVKGPKQFIPFVSSPPSPDAPLSVRPHETVPSFSLPSPSPTPVPPLSCAKAESEANIDLDDVLAAAQAAAESAEHAAAAARAAASLAKVRISEITTRRNGKASDKGENEFLADSSIPRDVVVKQESDRQHLSFDTPMPEPESPSSSNHQYTHQPVRSTSLEDDSYFSYPNLFSRQNSERRTTVADNSRSSHEP